MMYIIMCVALSVCCTRTVYNVQSPLQVILSSLSTQEANFDVSKAQRGTLYMHNALLILT